MLTGSYGVWAEGLRFDPGNDPHGSRADDLATLRLICSRRTILDWDGEDLVDGVQLEVCDMLIRFLFRHSCRRVTAGNPSAHGAER